LPIFEEKITKLFNIKKKKFNTLIPNRAFFFNIPQVAAQVGDQYILSIFTSPNQVSPLLLKAFMQSMACKPLWAL
jgi:hypothetical protein